MSSKENYDDFISLSKLAYSEPRNKKYEIYRQEIFKNGFATTKSSELASKLDLNIYVLL